MRVAPVYHPMVVRRGWKLAAIPKTDVPPSAIVIDPAGEAE